MKNIKDTDIKNWMRELKSHLESLGVTNLSIREFEPEVIDWKCQKKYWNYQERHWSCFDFKKFIGKPVTDFHPELVNGILLIPELFNEKTLNEVYKLITHAKKEIWGFSNYWTHDSSKHCKSITITLYDSSTDEETVLCGLNEIRKVLKN